MYNAYVIHVIIPKHKQTNKQTNLTETEKPTNKQKHKKTPPNWFLVK